MAPREVVIAGKSYSNIAANDQAQLHIGDNINITNTYELHCKRTIAIRAADRIGLTACVSGLKRQTDALFTQVLPGDPTQSQSSRLSSLPSGLVHNLVESKAILAQFEVQLRNIARLPQERTSLIQADHLVVSFTNAVMLMDEIQSGLSFLHAPLAAPTEETNSRLDLADLSQRLSGQCGIWQTQLDLLQCSSNEEAHDTSFTLQDKVDILLADNNELKQRMESFEHELTMLARNTRPTLDINRPGREHAHALRGASRLSLSSQEFEDLLQQSWVYRRNEHREETMSFNSSVIRDYAWSELSKLTLAHLSIISVIALPVKASELADSSWYEPNINTALRALELHISTTASARQVGPKSPERSRKLEIFDEENGRRLQALEARLEIMMGWIENELRAEHDEMQKQNLEEMGREMGNAVAKFKTSLRENPGVLQVNGRESNFSSSSTLLASITSSGSKSRATDVLDQELCPLHDGKGSLYNEVSATMRVLDEFNHDPTASTFLSLQSELARKLPLHKRLRLSDPVPTSTLTAWRRIFTREAEVQSESAELLVLRGQMQKDLNNAGNAQSNFRRNQTRPDTPGSNAIALDDQLFSCEGYLTLDLSQRALAELPLGHLRKMKNQVRILVLDDNKISIFKGAKKALGQLQVLRMRRNGLVNIPEELTTMDLQSLDISHNFIEHIPETMTRMKLLQELTAHGNAFAELPAAVWKMEGLEKLYVQWSVWRAWCEVNKECVDWKVIKRYDVGLYTLGWVELERDRHLSFMP